MHSVKAFSAVYEGRPHSTQGGIRSGTWTRRTTPPLRQHSDGFGQ